MIENQELWMFVVAPLLLVVIGPIIFKILEKFDE